MPMDKINPLHEVYIIIGNGFDKACGLMTTYPEFLDFINAVDLHFQGVISYNDEPKQLLEKYKAIRKEISRTIDLSKWKGIPQNFWYKHFRRVHIRTGWIDFEREIARVIRIVTEEAKKAESLDQLVLCNPNTPFFTEIYDPLMQAKRIQWKVKEGSREMDITYLQLRDLLLNELNEVTNAFDYYLQDYVESKKTNLTGAVTNLFDKLKGAGKCCVLSFNYTTTFEKLLLRYNSGLNVDYCYVHGKVGTEDKPGKLVLGIDEKYESEGEISVAFAPFKKYYQRVYKGTDSNYADWLHGITNDGHHRELYIFGHSLGVTDKDILNAFITGHKMKTTVYSHCDKARADHIANMTAIIGIDDMVRRNAGSDRSLEFEMQE